MKLQFTNKQYRALTIVVVIALAFGAYFLRGFFGVIVAAMIVAYLFHPLYNWLLRKTKRVGLAATITFFATVLAVAIPITLIILVTVQQANVIIGNASHFVRDGSFQQLSQDINTFISGILDKLPGDLHVNTQQIQDAFQSGLTNLAKGVVNILKGSIGSITSFITSTIIYIYVFLAVLIHSKTIIETVKRLNPLGDELSELYLDKMGKMTNAMVRGQFIIALVQGLLSAAALAFVGVGYFGVFALILTVLSFIPLGAGIVTIPIGIVLILLGDYWQGIGLILWHLFVVTNVDNILRPRLVPKDARLNSALTMLAVFAGIGMFGFIGIVLGPVIMILIVSTVQAYLTANQNKQAQKSDPAA